MVVSNGVEYDIGDIVSIINPIKHASIYKGTIKNIITSGGIGKIEETIFVLGKLKASNGGHLTASTPDKRYGYQVSIKEVELFAKGKLYKPFNIWF